MHLWVLVALVLPTMEMQALPDNEHVRVYHTERGCEYVQRRVEKEVADDKDVPPLRLACIPLEAAEEYMTITPKADPGEV